MEVYSIDEGNEGVSSSCGGEDEGEFSGGSGVMMGGHGSHGAGRARSAAAGARQVQGQSFSGDVSISDLSTLAVSSRGIGAGGGLPTTPGRRYHHHPPPLSSVSELCPSYGPFGGVSVTLTPNQNMSLLGMSSAASFNAESNSSLYGHGGAKGASSISLFLSSFSDFDASSSCPPPVEMHAPGQPPPSSSDAAKTGGTGAGAGAGGGILVKDKSKKKKKKSSNKTNQNLNQNDDDDDDDGAIVLSVRFHSRVKVRRTIPHKRYTLEELNAVWMTDEDKIRNERDIVETIDLMRKEATAGETTVQRQRQQTFSDEGGWGGGAGVYTNKYDTGGFGTNFDAGAVGWGAGAGMGIGLVMEGEEDDMLQGGKYCTRGLEHMRTAQLAFRRRSIRRDVVEAVLREQERQWLEELHNSVELAAASGALTARSKAAAAERAASDEAYAAARRRSSQLKALHNAVRKRFGVGSGAIGLHGMEGGSRGGSLHSSTNSAEGERRRSSGLSFEKHGDEVLEELAAIADRLDQEEKGGNGGGAARADEEKGKNDDDGNGGGERGMDPTVAAAPVISRIEESIIQREIDAGVLMRDDNMGGDCGEENYSDVDGAAGNSSFGSLDSDGGDVDLRDMDVDDDDSDGDDVMTEADAVDSGEEIIDSLEKDLVDSLHVHRARMSSSHSNAGEGEGDGKSSCKGVGKRFKMASRRVGEGGGGSGSGGGLLFRRNPLPQAARKMFHAKLA